MRLLILVTLMAAPLAVQPQPVRAGVYGTRAIAVAYAHSPSPSMQTALAAKRKELEAAKAAGDTAKAQQLDAWGQAQQRKLHGQGFSRVPVADLLAHVKDRLPEAAARAGVQVIAAECGYLGANAVTVDITGELVRLFDPSPRVLSIVQDMKGKPPLPLEELGKIDE